MCGWSVNFMNNGKLCTHHHLASSCVVCNPCRERSARKGGREASTLEAFTGTNGLRHKYILILTAGPSRNSARSQSSRRPSPLPHFALSQGRAPPRKCTLTLPPPVLCICCSVDLFFPVILFVCGVLVSVCACAPHTAPSALCLHGTCGRASCEMQFKRERERERSTRPPGEVVARVQTRG